MAVDMEIYMDIQAQSVDMDMNMDGKFHIHGNPDSRLTKSPKGLEFRLLSFYVSRKL